MATHPVQVLDELVHERLGRSWDIRRQQAGNAITYDVCAPDGGRVELGQSHGVHLWFSLPQGWRSDTHGDDIESLIYDLNEYITMADAILSGLLVVPDHAPDSRRPKHWKVPEYGLVMRRSGR